MGNLWCFNLSSMSLLNHLGFSEGLATFIGGMLGFIGAEKIREYLMLVLKKRVEKMFKFSQRSEKHLQGVHDDLVKVVRKALEYSTVDFAVIEGVRTKARQAQLFKQGATKQ
ncbi:phage holin family protein [Avibacterium paragallinarum]|uniref:Phage holin, lambda family n=1 Tax=Avibacterium paragallinarum TaxID=728 RepID=A0A380X642_AVIPA|nr:phage holin family protein [Avibacterium paragallinarum]SUU98745.1 phage holin, lambda family [Avibacterium paragallinarum]